MLPPPLLAQGRIPAFWPDSLWQGTSAPADSLDLGAAVGQELAQLRLAGYPLARVEALGDSLPQELVPGPFLPWRQVVWPQGDFPQGPDPTRCEAAEIWPRAMAHADLLLRHWADRGHPFAKIAWDQSRPEQGVLVARLELGPAIHYDSLVVKGEASLSERYLRRLLALRQGKPFSLKDLEMVSKRVAQLGHTQQIRPYELEFGPDDVDIFLYLRPGRGNRFAGTLGILPRDQARSSALLTGELDLSLANFLGAGEALALRWQRMASASQRLEFDADWPFAFGSPLGMAARLGFERQDSTFARLDRAAQALLFFDGLSHLALTATARRVLALGQGASSEALGQTSGSLVGAALRLRGLDDPFAPRRGLDLALSAAFGQKQDDLGAMAQQDYALDLAWAWPLGGIWGAFVQYQAKSQQAERLYFNELYRIGGLRSLRGFDERALFVSSYLLGRHELRLHWESRSFFSAFADWAWAERRTILGREAFLALGLGLGMSFETPGGEFSLNLALGKLGDAPFSVSAAKIHLGYRVIF